MEKHKTLLYGILMSLCLLPLSATGKNVRPEQEIAMLTERLLQTVLEQEVDETALQQNRLTLQPDGSWTDIDYQTVTMYFDAGKHLKRLLNMTLGYCKPESKHYQSATLLKQVLLALDYFYRQQPSSTNWWYIDIGAPQEYMCVLLLLKGKIDRKTLLYYAAYLKDRTSNRAHQGKNRTWVSIISLYKGCIEDDVAFVVTGFQSIASTIKIVDTPNEEGIKIDCSIHQHRPQLYSGGYGMSFIADLVYLISLSDGLSYATLFTPEKRAILSKTLLQGQLLFGYRNGYDFGTIGRNISRPNALNNISPRTLQQMMQIDPTSQPLYQAWEANLAGKPFPVLGNKYFWKSAIMTHHGADYYLSAKVASVRNNGTEMLNGENLKGYYLPLGATNILTTGEEYKNIFPVWDWTRIPGTTALANQTTAGLHGYHFGSNRLGGGVSNGKCGVIAFEHAHHGVQAWKSYFFLDDAMLCLGAGIEAAKTQMVQTSVNQCFLEGDVYVGRAGKTEKLTVEKLTSDSISWVYHHGVGYLFPLSKRVVVQQKEQSGSWREINESGSEEKVLYPVFSLWQEHGNAPVDEYYCYFVLPSPSLDAFAEKRSTHGFEVITNTKQVQAVRNRYTRKYGLVFYVPGEVQLTAGLKLAVDKPAIIFLQEKEEGLELSVADPLYQARTVTIRLSRKFQSKDWPYQAGYTLLNVALPQGDLLGSTTTIAIY